MATTGQWLASGTLAFFMALNVSANAQDNSADGAQAQDTDDVITVRSRGAEDYAMDAFRRGDYETAEIEFLANTRCALRRERNLAASVDSAQREAVRGEVSGLGQPNNASAANPGGGGNSSAPAPAIQSPSAGDRITAGGGEPTGRSCDDRAFQLYMTALSQLQLGKIDEAYNNLVRAADIDETLYDAHYRVALISLLRGDKKAAERRLKRIETVRRRCRECEAASEIDERIEHLKRAITDQVGLQ